MNHRAGRFVGTHRAIIGHAAVLVLAGFIGAAPLSAGPIETLAAADKELKSGNHDLSITHADNAIASGKLAPEELARALYIRGSSYLAAGKSSQAIVDLNAALWMKKLPPRLQSDAKAKRYQAYTGAGVAPRAAVASRPGRTQRTISSAAPPSKQAPAQRSSISEGGHKVALPVERQTGLPEGTHARPLVLNSRAQETRAKTILAPLPVTQTTPKWTSSTRQVSRPPIVQPRAPVAPARQPLNAAVPAVTKAPLVKPRPRPARSVASTRWPAASTARASVGPFTTQTKVTPRPANVTRRPAPPVRTEPQPAAAPSVAAVRPAASAPYTPPPRPAPATSYGVRDGLYEDTPRASVPETAAATDSTGGSSFFGGLIGGAEPKSEALIAADELQRRRTERIREHNRRLAAEE